METPISEYYILGIIKGLEISYKVLERSESTLLSESQIRLIAKQKLDLLNQLKFWKDFKNLRKYTQEDLLKFKELQESKIIDQKLLQTNLDVSMQSIDEIKTLK